MSWLKRVYIKNMVVVWLFGIDLICIVSYLLFPGISFLDNLFSEIIGMNITVLILDAANKKRADMYEANNAFEDDIQSYARFFFNSVNRIQAIREMIDKNIEKGLIFKAKQDLRIYLDDPPLTRSFIEKHITKDRGKRITRAVNYAQSTIQRLDELLNREDISKDEYIRAEEEIVRAGMSILELRARNKAIDEKGSLLDGIEE